MSVAGSYDRLAVLFGNAARLLVEIEASCKKPAQLDRVEQFEVVFQLPPQAAARWIVGVRRDNQRVLLLLRGNLRKSVQLITSGPEVVDQNMLVGPGHHLHRRNQRNSMRCGKFIEFRVPDIQVVAGDGQNLILQPRGFPNEVFGRIVADPVVNRVKVAMGMQFRFEPTHGLLIGRIAAARPKICSSASGCPSRHPGIRDTLPSTATPMTRALPYTRKRYNIHCSNPTLFA